MGLEITTHEIQKDRTCVRCRVLIPTIFRDEVGIDVRVGDHIGIITGLRHSEPSAYLIERRDYDSNLPCQPR
jgi:hypothetical protein